MEILESRTSLFLGVDQAFSRSCLRWSCLLRRLLSWRDKFNLNVQQHLTGEETFRHVDTFLCLLHKLSDPLKSHSNHFKPRHSSQFWFKTIFVYFTSNTAALAVNSRIAFTFLSHWKIRRIRTVVVEQLVEHLLPTPEIRGSNPVDENEKVLKKMKKWPGWSN